MTSIAQTGSSTKHTGGPWYIQQAPGSDVRTLWAGAAMLGNVRAVPGMQPEVVAANANLIAAAPDLLAACEAYYFGRKEARECESMMGAAIRKARGEA